MSYLVEQFIKMGVEAPTARSAIILDARRHLPVPEGAVASGVGAGGGLKKHDARGIPGEKGIPGEVGANELGTAKGIPFIIWTGETLRRDAAVPDETRLFPTRRHCFGRDAAVKDGQEQVLETPE